MSSQKTIQLYIYVDGVNDVPFYGSDAGSEISPNGFLFNGSVNFFAIGKMNRDEAVEFNTLANNLITAMSVE